MKTTRASRFAELVGLLVLVSFGHAQETTVTSANGNPWDIDLNTGSMIDGGYDAFDGFGGLALRVMDAQGNILDTASSLGGFNLTYNNRVWTSATNSSFAGVLTARSLFAPADQNYVRYYDAFTNSTSAPLTVQVFLGGDLGSDDGTQLAFTSSGAAFTKGTYWTVTIENYGLGSLPAIATDPPVGLLFGNSDVVVGLASGIDIPWSGNGNDAFGVAFQFTLAPGQTAALLNYLYRGMEEDTTGPLGQPSPGLGVEQAIAVQVLTTLSQQPDLTGLSMTEIGQTLNLTTIPEPSTWLLLASGAGLLVLMQRRARRAA